MGLVFPHLLVWALLQASKKPPSEGQHHILESSDKVLGTRSDFPGGAVVKNLPANAGATGDVCSIPGLGRSPGVLRNLFLPALVAEKSKIKEPVDSVGRGPPPGS